MPSFLAGLWPYGIYAYIDLTAGGMLVQIIFGGLAGVAVVLKLFWHRISSFFSRFPRRRRRISSAKQESQSSASTDVTP